MRKTQRHIRAETRIAAGHAVSCHAPLLHRVEPERQILHGAALRFKGITAVARGIDARVIRLHVLVDGHALADGYVRSLQEREIRPHAARYGDEIGHIPLAGVCNRDEPAVFRRLDMVDRPAECQVHALLFEISLHALRRLRKECFGKGLVAAVHERAVHARFHEVLHDLDAAPRRAEHKTCAYLAGSKRFLEPHGVLYGAHGEYAR